MHTVAYAHPREPTSQACPLTITHTHTFKNKGEKNKDGEIKMELEQLQKCIP